MQDRQVSMENNDEYAVSQNTQRLIEHLEDLWQQPHELSPEKLKHLVGFVAHFPEPYRAMGITKIAEYLISYMGLHFLDIMATFQEKAQHFATRKPALPHFKCACLLTNKFNTPAEKVVVVETEGTVVPLPLSVLPTG